MTQEYRLRTQTARFIVGDASVSVTLPRAVAAADPPTLFLEVEGSPGEGLFLESGGEKAAVVNGAELRILPPAERERTDVRLVTAEGQTLCGWQPFFWTGWRTGEPAENPDAILPTNAELLRRVGDPVELQVGDGLPRGARDFEIDGLPAMALSRDRRRVILRDPHPAAGERTVSTSGSAVNLRFIDLEWRLSRTSKGRAELRIRIPRLPLRESRLWPRFPDRTASYTMPLLFIADLTQDRIRLECGLDIKSEFEPDLFAMRSLRITRGKLRGEAYAETCAVRILEETPPELDFEIWEPRPFHGRGSWFPW